ncbi:MAG: hypothetical protein ACK559_03075, partial [bacterium]
GDVRLVHLGLHHARPIDSLLLQRQQDCLEGQVVRPEFLALVPHVGAVEAPLLQRLDEAAGHEDVRGREQEVDHGRVAPAGEAVLDDVEHVIQHGGEGFIGGVREVVHELRSSHAGETIVEDVGEFLMAGAIVG